MATKEQLKRFRKLARGKEGRKKGSKNKKTLLKEQAILEMRERLIKRMTPEWADIMERWLKRAKTEKDFKGMRHLINQLIGTPKQETKIDASTEKLEEISKKIRKIAEG